MKVLLVEARTSLITGATIAVGTILGYSAMAGTIGGGGLGDLANRYGYQRFRIDVLIVSVIVILIIVGIIQMTGSKISSSLIKKR